ncbi:hypothetical protein YC2023_086802 [Brassica napus]
MQIQYLWRKTRSLVLLPVFKGLVIMCLVLSIIVFFESFYMNIVILFGKLLRRKPEKLYKWEAMQEDVEAGSENYPKVLVQIPMYNEKEVFQISIAAVCSLLWPASRLVIQVVDDSTDPVVREGVDIEIAKWQSQGINIRCERRDNRNGYKAGAMKEALTHNYVKQCDFVAVFDADFQPDPDYLARTIPFLVHNPDVALVQARWIFVNANKCLMTRMQEMSLNYHFKVEQESGFTRHAFFGFNGTAGVWRISAMDAAEGWKSRTTVEDMDLAVRVGLHGWKFVYLNDLTVRNELPSKFKAYRFQQHRWSCGPANLFRKMTMEIIYNKRVSIWKKFYVIYSFFFVRKVAVHFLTFFFYCIIVPTSVFFPEIHIPLWSTIYVPSMISIFHTMATPRSFYLVIIWILFENVMAMHRTKGTWIGLLEGGRVNEWVVTEKLGDALKNKLLSKVVQKKSYYESCRVNSKEVMVGIYILGCALYGVINGHTWLHFYLFLQATAFFVSGFGYIGT